MPTRLDRNVLSESFGRMFGFFLAPHFKLGVGGAGLLVV